MAFSSGSSVRAPENEDRIGVETLRRMLTVDRYNRWIFEEVSPFLGSSVLEVGCGIGNMTEFFATRASVTALDRLSASSQAVRDKFAGNQNVKVATGDIVDKATLEVVGRDFFDTVVCINVLEHIEQDEQALQHMFAALKPGGHLALFVPAGRYLYGSLDFALSHFRRYDRSPLGNMITATGFSIKRLEYLNLAGIPGWFLNSRILRRELLPEGQLKLFNALAPIFIPLERGLRRLIDIPLGQSLVCIGQKPEPRQG